MVAEEKEVRCHIRPGLFRSEYVVAIEAYNGGPNPLPIEFVADSSGVRPATQPVKGKQVPGTVRVWYLGGGARGARVQIPASGGSDSQIIDVPTEAVVS